MVKKTKIAICYDFDGTLSPDNMQEDTLIPLLGMNKDQFWIEVGNIAKKHNMDIVIAYMNLIIERAQQKNIPITKENLKKFGRNVRLYKGVETWFDRINLYAATKNLEVEHYIISSGIEEMILGTRINKAFKHIFASSFYYNKGIATMPATVVNYTNKTQHLFRINKGIFNYYENNLVNRHTPQNEKYIQFKDIIYIGDGETDVPSMKMVSLQGGHAIAVYDPKKEKSRQSAKDIYNHFRANFVAVTDYSKGSELEQIVKTVLDKLEIQAKFFELQKKIRKEISSL